MADEEIVTEDNMFPAPSEFDGITIDELITTLQIYKDKMEGTGCLEMFVCVQISEYSVIAPIDICEVKVEVVQGEPAIVLGLRP